MTLKQEEFLQEIEFKSSILDEITQQVRITTDEETLESLKRLGDMVASEIKIMLLVYDIMFSKVHLN